jgi:hypothetical protein
MEVVISVYVYISQTPNIHIDYLANTVTVQLPENISERAHIVQDAIKLLHGKKHLVISDCDELLTVNTNTSHSDMYDFKLEIDNVITVIKHFVQTEQLEFNPSDIQTIIKNVSDISLTNEEVTKFVNMY